jgi:dTDP-4-dehydrorhamnose reductase
LEKAAKHKAKKILYVSSAAVYGDVKELPVQEHNPTNPKSPYAISKLTSEGYVRHYSEQHGLEYAIVRPSNIFGPRQQPGGEAGVITIFMNKMLKGDVPVITGDGSQTRDFIYVEDAVKGFIAAMHGDVGLYNISSNTQTSINDLYRTLQTIIGAEIDPKYDPTVDCGIVHSRLCNQKAMEKLQFTAQKAFHEALDTTVQHFKNNGLPKNVWLVMAAYNEGERIGKVLKALNVITENIVVVDDCSKDNTSEVAKQYKCHVVRHPINFGQGAALQAGNDYAVAQGAEVIVHFDGDGQMQIKDIEPMITPILSGEADVTMGSRFLGSTQSNVPFTKRYFIHKPAIYLNLLLTGMKMSDAHCGFRALSREAAQKCVFKQDRMAHATEILDLVKTHNLRHKEVPVDILYHHYGQRFSKGFIILKDLLISKLHKGL